VDDIHGIYRGMMIAIPPLAMLSGLYAQSTGRHSQALSDQSTSQILSQTSSNSQKKKTIDG